MRANILSLVWAGGDFRRSFSQMAKRGQSFVVNGLSAVMVRHLRLSYFAGAGEDHTGCF